MKMQMTKGRVKQMQARYEEYLEAKSSAKALEKRYCLHCGKKTMLYKKKGSEETICRHCKKPIVR